MEVYGFMKKMALLLVIILSNYVYADNLFMEIVPFRYLHAAHGFHDGMAWVSYDVEKYGYINLLGEEIIPMIYDIAEDFSEGLAVVSSEIFTIQHSVGSSSFDSKKGFINTSGKEIIPQIYDYAKSFSEGLAAVSLNGKWGYIDKNGKEAISFIYNDAQIFSEGLAAVSVDEKWGYINVTGEMVIPLVYEKPYTANISPLRGNFNEGLAAVHLNNMYGFINTEGEIVIPCIYELVENFSEGLAGVRLKGKWGYIEKTGRVCVPFKYPEYISGFTNGLAVVYLESNLFSRGVIDTEGRGVHFSGSYCAQVNGLTMLCDPTRSSHDYYLINKEGEEIASIDSLSVYGFHDGISMLLPPNYMRPMKSGYIAIRSNYTESLLKYITGTTFFTIDTREVQRNDNLLDELPIAPVMVNNHPMLPFRYLVESILKGSVVYEDETQTLTAIFDAHKIVMQVNQECVLIDGTEYNYGQAPIIYNDRTLAPMQCFDSIVTISIWDSHNQTITIVP